MPSAGVVIFLHLLPVLGKTDAQKSNKCCSRGELSCFSSVSTGVVRAQKSQSCSYKVAGTGFEFVVTEGKVVKTVPPLSERNRMQAGYTNTWMSEFMSQ